jgi:iron complex outermembrane receptor protein
MKKKYFSAFFICSLIVNAQQNKQRQIPYKKWLLHPVGLPFKENSRTIQLITAEDIKKSG